VKLHAAAVYSFGVSYINIYRYIKYLCKICQQRWINLVYQLALYWWFDSVWCSLRFSKIY